MTDLQAYFRKVRADFPALSSQIYLDSAATAHKPQVVIDTLAEFYSMHNATVHRAVYSSSATATERYTASRTKIARFIHAPSPNEVIFTRGATDSLNLLADSLSRSLLGPDSTILVSAMEHHANLIPWQMAARHSGARLKVIPLTEEGTLCLSSLQALLSEGGVSIVALTHASNMLGTINPITEIAELVHAKGALLVVDGAQSAAHLPIDVQALGCDAFAFSAHKVYGPTGLGVLWAKLSLLEQLPPTRGGGDMVETAGFFTYTPREPPLKFEPGTPPIAEVVAFGAAIDYLSSLAGVHEWESALTEELLEGLKSINTVRIFGPTGPRCPLFSITVPHLHPLDLAMLLDLSNIAVRSGHLCCQPLLSRLGVSSVLRASLAFYNSPEDISTFLAVLRKIIQKYG